MPGLGEKVFQILSYGKKIGLPVMVNTMVTPEKLRSGEIFQMVEVLSSKGILMNVTLPVPQGRLKSRDSFLLSWDDLPLLTRLLSHPSVRTDTHSSLGDPYCPAGMEKLTVTPEGWVKGCQLLGKLYGRIGEEPLREIFLRARKDAIERGYREFPFCPPALFHLGEKG
jgi:MoaA/NifB/PqqE/SkfB family radical SAM enzyme